MKREVLIKRIIPILLLLILILDARDNPFFPSKGEVDIPYTSNEDRSLDPLKRATITIPSQARVIKKVTIEYINLDGTRSSSSIELNNSLDWYLPVFISQNMGEINSKTKTKIQTKKSPNTKANQKYKKIYSLGFITFYKKAKEFKIVTKDFMVRDFLLTHPHRIVMDFSKDVNVNSKVKNLDGRYYKKISFGSHKDYYRVVLELDGYYKYEKKSLKKGYSLFLR